METRKHISNDTDYKEVMSKIGRLMDSGSNKVTKDKLAEIENSLYRHRSTNKANIK